VTAWSSCRRWAERMLLAAAVACLGWYVAVSLQSAIHQREQEAALKRILSAAPRPGKADGGPQALPETRSGDLIGRLEIPRLNLSAIVVEGDDESALMMAVGHLPDTPLPWQGGNSALAAHRDTFFRPLKDIRVGDSLRVTTSHGGVEYLVRETLIVGPHDVWVLDPTPQASLTLITCYPFSYLGHAPKRFVVQADQVGRWSEEP
jgi:sortase A